MHDAFIQAFKNILQFDENYTFGAWLKKIAINRSINHLKRDKLIAQKLEDYKDLKPEEGQQKVQLNFTIVEIKKTFGAIAP
ncbi:MAG: RNA polymerase sigma-70 factor (ECF subfamily) [Vicingaceae bacterium]|jgi:RNA polymerase sigma-70 factor (ECF subfamily)